MLHLSDGGMALPQHGHARHAVEAAEGFAENARGMEEDAESEAKARLHAASHHGRGVLYHLRSNAGQTIDHGERHRAGERISTGFAESAGNRIVAKRCSTPLSMRRTSGGAHLMLQARTRVLHGAPENALRRRRPAFRPS